MGPSRLDGIIGPNGQYRGDRGEDRTELIRTLTRRERDGARRPSLVVQRIAIGATVEPVKP